MFISLGQPQAIQAIFTTLAPALELGKVADVFRPLTGDKSIIMQEGERHQRSRQLLMPALHGEQLPAYGQMIADIATGAIATWGALKQHLVWRGTTLSTYLLAVAAGVVLAVPFRYLK